MSLGHVLLVSILLTAACSSDDTGTSDTVEGSQTDTNDSGDTDNTGDTVTDSTDSTEDTTDTDVGPPPTLSIGTLATTVFCGGAAIEVPFSLTSESGASFSVQAHLSDANGSFDNFRIIGQRFTDTDGGVMATIPANQAAGTGYRVRLAIAEPAIETSDTGQDVEVLALPELDLTVGPVVVFVGDTVRFVDNTDDVATRTWTFPGDANVSSSSDAQVDVTFSAPGIKTVEYSVTSTAGCTTTETLDNAFTSVTVVSCTPTVPADADVVTMSQDSVNGGSEWICGGGVAEAFGGNITHFIEPGGRFNFKGGGSHIVYVREGARFSGANGGRIAVIHETGSLLGESNSNETRLECDTLTFDYSNAPANGCIPDGTTPDGVTVTPGTIDDARCPAADLTLPITVDGTVGSGNQFIVQLSDAAGSFDNAQTLTTVDAGGNSLSATLPAVIAPGVGYRVRVITSMPPSVGPEGEPFEIVAGAVARIEVPASKTLIGSEVTFTNISDPFVSSAWSFGDGSAPSTATSENGTTTYSTAGFKTVTLSITDALGCVASTTLDEEALEVLSCDIAIGGDATVLGPGLYERPDGDPLWICGGAQADVSGGGQTAIVEANGALDFRGGGSHILYVRAGASFSGGNGGRNTVVYETGAEIVDADRMDNVLECAVLSVDTTNAPTPGCQPFTLLAPSLSLGEPEKNAFCIDEGFGIPVTGMGFTSLSTRFSLELSDTSGDFGTPTVVGGGDSRLGGELFGRFREGDVPVGAGYRMRATSDDPALVSNRAAAVLTFEATPDIELDHPNFVAVGAPFTITNLTEGDAEFVWSQDGAEVSTERSPTFTIDAHGYFPYDVTATTSAGCEDDRQAPIAAYTCAPPILTDAVAVTGDGGSDSGGASQRWICDGGTYRAGGGLYMFFLLRTAGRSTAAAAESTRSTSRPAGPTMGLLADSQRSSTSLARSSTSATVRRL
ncbi:MAG: hypothetical protein ACI9MR_002359 [Myxococcota bacterium]|jgi:hypothetical protein